MIQPTRVLLLDVDDAEREAGCLRLEEAGLDVIEARSFIDALPHLRPGSTDVVVLALPEDALTQSAILAQIRRAVPTVPLLAMTASRERLRPVLEAWNAVGVPPVAGDGWHETVGKIHDAVASTKPSAGSSGEEP